LTILQIPPLLNKYYFEIKITKINHLLYTKTAMFRRILLVFTEKELRTKLLQIIGLLIIARLLAHVPIPLFDIKDLTSVIEGDQFLGLLNTIAGGSYGRLSFVMLGIGPYITASIVMQLMGIIVPKIREIQKEEGEMGQQKINRWTRYIAVPISALNSWGILQFLANSPTQQKIVELPLVLSGKEITLESFGWWFVVIASMTCGSIVMMWIGEIINEYKMGNGISMMILAGIAARLPSKLFEAFGKIGNELGTLFGKFSFGKLFDFEVWKAFLFPLEFGGNPAWEGLRLYAMLFGTFLFTLLLVVFFNDAVRRVIIIYSRRGHSEGKSRTMANVHADLPIKVNIAGVLPIIFAVSLILFPTILSRFFFTANVPALRDTAQGVENFLSTANKDEYQNLRGNLRFPGSPKNEFAGFYNTNSKEEIAVATTNDKTKGAELGAFTLSTNSEIPNVFFDSTPARVQLPSTNLGFLPQGAIRWNGILAYTLIYFLLIIFFTYFYTSEIAFKTDEVAENLQKSGAYIPGYNPGEKTANYLSYVANRLNVVGALFLALIAVVPLAFQDKFTPLDPTGTLVGVVGGTTLLILVSVTIETLKQIEAQATSVDYNRFTKY
jgi:preprotein translocase SecY subunit